jgi:hypothetical protein
MTGRDERTEYIRLCIGVFDQGLSMIGTLYYVRKSKRVRRGAFPRCRPRRVTAAVLRVVYALNP